MRFIIRITITAFLLIHNLPSFGQASVYFLRAYAFKWEHNGIKYEMLTFNDDIKVSDSYYYSTREADLLMPITARIKSTDINAKVNIVEFETEALFKYTFKDREATGFQLSIFPKNGKRVIQGEDKLARWEYRLNFDTTSTFVKGNVERINLTAAAMAGITDTENDAAIYGLETTSTEEDIKMINSFFTKESTPLHQELLLRFESEEVYVEKKADELYKFIKKMIDTKWSSLKGKLINKDDDGEVLESRYETSLKLPGIRSSMLEYFKDKEVLYLSSISIDKPSRPENEIILEHLIKKMKSDFKELSKIEEDVSDKDTKRHITFSKPDVLLGLSIVFYLGQNERLIIDVYPEKFN